MVGFGISSNALRCADLPPPLAITNAASMKHSSSSSAPLSRSSLATFWRCSALPAGKRSKSASHQKPTFPDCNNKCIIRMPVILSDSHRRSSNRTRTDVNARPGLVQPSAVWLRGCHPDRRSDRARLMVDHPPSTIDASEPVRCGKRKGVATDQFDANHPALIAANHRDGVVRFDPVLVRIAENVAVRFQVDDRSEPATQDARR